MKSPGQILEGWSLNSVVTIQTGLPWGVSDGSNDFSGTGEVLANRHPRRVNNGISSATRPTSQPFTGLRSTMEESAESRSSMAPLSRPPDTSASAALRAPTRTGFTSPTRLLCVWVTLFWFLPPTEATVRSGRNIFRDSGFRNWDLSVTKDWKFKERLTAQFRAEFFNVLNHPNFANPYGGASGGSGTHDPSAGAGSAAAAPLLTSGRPTRCSGQEGTAQCPVGLEADLLAALFSTRTLAI